MPKYVEHNHRQTMGHKTQATRSELRRTSSEKFEARATFTCRELLNTLEGSEDCRGRKEFSIQEI
jgi:hypothetical protein